MDTIDYSSPTHAVPYTPYGHHGNMDPPGFGQFYDDPMRPIPQFEYTLSPFAPGVGDHDNVQSDVIVGGGVTSLSADGGGLLFNRNGEFSFATGSQAFGMVMSCLFLRGVSRDSS